MNILLPKPPFVFNNGAAVVEGNLLYIYRPVDFRELMYALTNAIYDEGRICYYCGAEITEKQRTMDHKYPQDFGGPTITDNLVPTCKKCNTTKGNLMEDEFKEFMKIENVEAAKAYRVAKERGHRKIHTGKVSVIPEEWICPKDYPLNEILEFVELSKSSYYYVISNTKKEDKDQEIKEKIKQSMIVNYGVEHYFQNELNMCKSVFKKYVVNNEYFDSLPELAV